MKITYRRFTPGEYKELEKSLIPLAKLFPLVFSGEPWNESWTLRSQDGSSGGLDFLEQHLDVGADFVVATNGTNEPVGVGIGVTLTADYIKAKALDDIEAPSEDLLRELGVNDPVESAVIPQVGDYYNALVIVHPDKKYRGQGIGTELKQRRIKIADERDVEMIWVRTLINHTQVWKMYANAGFRLRGLNTFREGGKESKRLLCYRLLK